ncbi:hypothetical protein BASA50_008811 [Batrachochytrium salamandrivorans]|uniref:Uncharacterized protein n=1 Tax=Batrachochytrium salamandrivorans TaxID=1357716 RepID=A0ABQ8F329_9FUNG|nr:hypothetical protein BASA50_008811 [Batrachochytrium salamandrivorans]
MKLASFAVIAFLAAMASAGDSETPGNPDYTAHQLEKRDIVDDMKKQLKEKVDQGMEDYRAILGEYWDMMHRGEELETRLFQARFVSEDSDYGPSGPILNGRHDMAQVLYESQYETCYEKHISMMKVKEKLQEARSELIMLNVNQQKLKEHNRIYPDDPWTVTASTHFNRKILIKQIDDACEDIDTVSVLEVETETQLDYVYGQLMTPGSDKNALRTHYIETNQMLMDAKDEAWMKNVMCEHMVLVDRRLFGART